MPITTLENTKWTFKNTLPFASYAGTYNIIFSNDGKSCTSLEVTSNKILYHYNGGTLIAYQDGNWTNEKRKTIYIADGTDVANSTLIEFITNYATQQELPTYGIYNRNKVVGLAKAIRAKTGTTALLNHTKMIDVVNNINLQKEELEKTYNLDFTNGNIVDTAPTGKAFSKVTIVKPSTLIPSNILSPVEIAGVQGSIETYATPETLGKVYKFNISPTIPNTAKTYTYNFKSNGTQYTYLAMGNNIITYANSGGEDIVYNNGWTNEEYRTLCFEEVPQGELLTMLNSNAIRQNGELYFTENGETTLATQGKYLDGNLKVIVNVKQLDTSDANATSSDIRYTKSAYVNGVKVEGSIQDYANETVNLFSITGNLTNVSATIPEYIEESETLMIAITADDGYVLPDSISVSGCTYTYNKDNGEISLSGASGDVVIGVVGVQEPSGETWVINENPIVAWGTPYECSFTSNGETFNALFSDPDDMYGDGRGVKYFRNYPQSNTNFLFAYNWRTKIWLVDQAYRTITFETAPTGDLLSWLQANATKQTTTTPTLINFTINGTSYQAEEGMTWEEWCNSSYNTGGFYVALTSIVIDVMGSTVKITGVTTTDIITSGRTYYLSRPSGGGGGSAN